MTDDIYSLIAADNALADIMYSIVHKHPSTAEIRKTCREVHYHLYGTGICNAPQDWRAKVWALSDALLDSPLGHNKDSLLSYRLREEYKKKIR